MNGNKAKHHKRGKRGLKTKTKDGEAEVFVLPPDLLQKLGIHLGNVRPNEGSPKELASTTLDSASNLPNQEVAPRSYYTVAQAKKETSILETAILMKKSVLLSPTFVPNGIQGELEISNILEINKQDIDSTENEIKNEQKEYDSVYIAPNADILPKINECDLQGNNLQQGNKSRDCLNDGNDANSIIQSEVDLISPTIQDIKEISALSNSLNTNTVTVLETSMEDHADEAYLSDSSNSNIGLTEKNYNLPNIPETHLCKTSDPNYNNKINIICEEILSSSQLKELKTFHSPNLIPVPVSTIITGNQKNVLLSSNDLRESELRQISVSYPDEIQLDVGHKHIDNVLHNPRTKLQKTENFVLYDEKGSIIHENTDETTVNNELQIKVMSVDDTCDVLTMANSQDEISDLNLSGLSQTENQGIFNKTDAYSQYSTNGACMNFVVSDIEEHLEDNEELLGKIVEDIASDKTDLLLDKIENCSNTCLGSSDIKLEFTQIVTNNNAIVESKYMLDSEINQIDKFCKRDIDDNMVDIDEVQQDYYLSTIEDECFEKHQIDENIAAIPNKSMVKTVLEEKEIIDKPSEFLNRLDVSKPVEMKINENYRAENEILENTEDSNIVCINQSKTSHVFKTDLDCLSKATEITKTTDSHLNENSIPNTNKVEEIAMYLSQFASHHFNTGKNKSKSKSCNNKKRSVDKSKHENLKSKLCIQGVEKPGGLQNEKINYKKPTILRTYGRSNTSQRSSLPIAISSLDPKSDEQNSTTLLDTKTNNFSPIQSCKIGAFCICDDFGRLDYYDCDGLYEHIHFWEHKNIYCSDALVFSMYNDGCSINYECNENATTSEQDNTENITLSICWNDLHNYDEKANNYLASNNAVEINSVSGIGIDKIDITVEEPKSGKEAIEEHVCNYSEESNIYNKNISPKNDIPESKKTATEIIHFVSNETLTESHVVSVIDEEHTDTHGCESQNKMIDEKSETNNTFQSEKGSRKSKGFDEISEKKNCKYVRSKKRKLSSKQDDHSETQETDEIICTIISEAGKGATELIKFDNNETSEKNCVKSVKAQEKRKLSSKQYGNDDDSIAPDCKKTVKCGVCKQLFTEKEWQNHISKDHCLIAWREGNSFDFEDPELFEKLQKKIKKIAILKCTFCGTPHQDVTDFLSHVHQCWKKKSPNIRKVLTSPKDTSKEIEKICIKCGVCKKDQDPECWMKHLADEHSYLAWKDGEPALAIDDEEAVLEHLRNILHQLGTLICSKCGLERKYVKSYLRHIRNCSETLTAESTLDDTLDKSQNPVSSTDSTNPSLNKNVQDVISNDNTASKVLRKRSVGMSPMYNKVKSEESESDIVYTKCGVCECKIAASEWLNHIEKQHNYLAWKNGEPKLELNDEEQVRKHLYDISKELGGLTCSKCGLTRKYVKAYLSHVKSCSATEDINVKIEKESVTPDTSVMVKCGVCGKEMECSSWYDHIGKEHEYMGWKEGEPSIDFCDEEKLQQHLQDISKKFGGLTCHKCGYNRKYVKVFLQHLKTCIGPEVAKESKVTETDSKYSENTLDSVEENQSPVQCGVCQKEVEPKQWISHIQRAHNYLAWKTGEVLDLENHQAVNDHLYAILTETGGLTCNKCGLMRKYVKVFLKHIENCATVFDYATEISLSTQDEYECGVCSKKIPPKDWLDHKMNMHYNVAWIVGESPIDLNNPYMIERFLKVYKEKYNKLVCNVCGVTRASCVGFYAHVVVCGKTEEETEEFYNVCDVCNKKYLRLYHNQHMAAHAQQEYAKQRKLKEAEAQSKAMEDISTDSPSGRRRAAEKARNVIENYNTTLGQAEFQDHKSDEIKDLYSDSDTSVGSCSDDESSESDVDSSISDEEKMSPIKKRSKTSVAVSAKLERFPYTLLRVKPYLLKSAEDYCKYHFTNDKLFVDWDACEFEPVSDDQLLKYLPRLEESCKVKQNGKDWETYKRFEGRQSSIFVGASIRCIAWAPPSADDNDDNYLAVACHPGVDSPRYVADKTVEHSSLVQIWNFGNFSTVPKFVLGLAHDYGTVWSMDWCPSGVRDSLSNSLETDKTLRLGLLAVACSNGLAYIFSVPYPSKITQNENLVFKLKPVAELRLLMGSDRPKYPATSLSWSQQKDHSLLVVGYGDGTVAYYDLTIDSPLLKTKEQNVTVIYPHHDERVHNTCVTGVDIYPSADPASSGAVCSSAPTGGAAVLRAGLQPVRSYVFAAASDAKYQPLWPSVLLCGDDAIIHTMPSEIEWYGVGRRLGGINASAPCVRCARVAITTPPLLRLMRSHPAGDLLKQTLGSLTMTSLGKKRKRTIDELAIKVEPSTYEEAVTKYGIELILDEKIQGPNANKPCNPDPGRFPLADVSSLAFCSSAAHHNRLAVATHAGIIFLIRV